MLAEVRQFALGRSTAIGRDRFDKRPVGGEEIDILERRRLIEDLVGGEGGFRHGRSLPTINGGAVRLGNHKPGCPRRAAKSATIPLDSSQSLAAPSRSPVRYASGAGPARSCSPRCA